VLKISEVYEKQIKEEQERPDGSVHSQFSKVFVSRDVLINPSYVVSISPHEPSSDIYHERLWSRFPEGTKFSTFVMDGNSFRSSEMLVVGSFEKFCRLLQDNPT